MPAWSTGVSLRGSPGVAGLSVLTGNGSPASGLGAQGQPYIDTAAGVLYVKGASAWSTGTSLVGPQGTSVLTGSGAPASTLGVQGQAYIDTVGANLYVKGASAWSAAVPLIGPQGLSVLTGSGVPASSLGAFGQAYIDVSGGVLYSRGTSGWNVGTSLVGPQGPALRNGTGAPTTSPLNPSIQNDGDYYIQNDAGVIWGPRTNGSWGSTTVAIGGTVIRQSNGYPAANLGNVGDYAIDTTNGFLYGPKSATLGWGANQPMSIVGPQGVTGQVQPSFGTFSAGYGPAAYANAMTLNNTGQNGSVSGIAGTQNFFVPVTNSAFMGAQIVNFGTSPSSCLWRLVNNTTGAIVYTGSSVGAGTVATVPIQATTTYPLVAGNSYSWQILGTGSGFSSYIVPLYLFQCGAAQGVSTFAPFTMVNATLSGTGQVMNPAGFTANTMYYNSPKAGYLYSVQVSVSGSISANVSFGGYTTSAVTAANSPQYFGPFVAASNTLAAGTNYLASVTGSGTGNVVMIPSVVS